MVPSRDSTPVGRAAAEKMAANTTSPDGSDSGYASAGNTTEGSTTTDHSQELPDGVALPSRSFFERKVTKLRIFDREIPQLTQHRFHDLHELFERPLCEYLIKAKVNPNPISVKLKVLGESEATAKPWIVVLCNKTASKKIRHFFNQQQIKAEYQPRNPDSFIPSFEVFVCNRPPRPMAGTDIYGDHDERATMCGRIIKLGEAHQSRFATLGGAIKVVKPPGIVTLYGMTAGHILMQQPLGQDNFDQVDFRDIEEDGDEEDEGFYSGEEEYELDDSFDVDDGVQDLAIMGDRIEYVPRSTQLGSLWPRIGCVSTSSVEGTETGHDLDWALIDFDKPADCRPNLLVLFDREEEAAINRPLKENGNFTEDGSSRSVFLLSGTGGVKKGILSTSLSFLMMGPTKTYTKTYTLILPHTTALNAGDCGSWVVDPSTCEVYGHVVASDAMGDTYVVPLNATLRDMEEQLGAESVSLPTEADINTWLAQHAKAASKQVKVPAKSKKKKVAFNDFEIDVAENPEPRKLAGPATSQASTSSASPSIKTSTSIVDFCNSCNARYEGTSQDVGSNLLRHLQTCSRQNKDAAPGIGNPISQDAKDTPPEQSKRSSIKYSNDIQQKTTNNTSAQQTSPVPGSIRSIYSSLRRKSTSDSQRKDGDKGKGVSTSKDSKTTGFGFSKKPATTPPPTPSAKDSKTNMKKSNSKKDSASPLVSNGFPAHLPALAGRISGSLPRAPPGPPVILDHRQSLPIAAPSSSSLRLGGRLLATPPPPPPLYSNPPLAHGHGSFHESGSDPRHLSYNKSSIPVSYEGYTFTKCKPSHTGQKETWAVASMSPMPVSQEDLKNHIKRNGKKRVSALDEYNDENMKGFKRKQVDNLIRERTKIDGDYGYEYVLASIKLESRKPKSKSTETVSMQVILIRQLRADFPHEPSTGPSMDLHAKLHSQIMDLAGGDGYGGGSKDTGYETAGAFLAGHPVHGALPMRPVNLLSNDRGIPNVNDRARIFHAPAQPDDVLEFPARGTDQPYSPHQENYIFQSQWDEVKKPKDKKQKSPKDVHRKPDFPSQSSSFSDLSLELESDTSWAKTDATPDTLVSGDSREASREDRKERKSDKASKERSYDKDNIIRMPIAHGTERPVDPDSRREEHKFSSLPPVRMSSGVSSDDLDRERHGRRATSPRYSSGLPYRDHGRHEIEPAISFRVHNPFHHRRSSVSPEPRSHRRTLSYDFDRPLTHSPRALVPMRLPPDLYDHGAELTREREGRERERHRLEREEIRAYERRERERRERIRIERVRERTREQAWEMERVSERIRGATYEREGSRRGTTYHDDMRSRNRDADDYN